MELFVDSRIIFIVLVSCFFSSFPRPRTHAVLSCSPPLFDLFAVVQGQLQCQQPNCSGSRSGARGSVCGNRIRRAGKLLIGKDSYEISGHPNVGKKNAFRSGCRVWANVANRKATVSRSLRIVIMSLLAGLTSVTTTSVARVAHKCLPGDAEHLANKGT